jgi:hypothetical protein
MALSWPNWPCTVTSAVVIRKADFKTPLDRRPSPSFARSGAHEPPVLKWRPITPHSGSRAVHGSRKPQVGRTRAAGSRHRAGWRNAKRAGQWEATLATCLSARRLALGAGGRHRIGDEGPRTIGSEGLDAVDGAAGNREPPSGAPNPSSIGRRSAAIVTARTRRAGAVTSTSWRPQSLASRKH